MKVNKPHLSLILMQFYNYLLRKIDQNPLDGDTDWMSEFELD